MQYLAITQCVYCLVYWYSEERWCMVLGGYQKTTFKDHANFCVTDDDLNSNHGVHGVFQ